MPSNQHLIDILNQFLRLAKTAKLQYEQHLSLIDHEPAQSIMASIVSDEEQHIQRLIHAIEHAGGIPASETEEIATPEEFEIMMREDFDMESSIIKEYEIHLQEIWDAQTRSLMQDLLSQARQHRESFQGLVEDFGTDEFMDEAAV